MPHLPLSLAVRPESWPIAGSFSISRSAKSEAQIVVAELREGGHRGRDECVPDARYGETVKGAVEALRKIGRKLASGRMAGLYGALLLAKDRPGGLRYQGSLVHPSTSKPWG